MGRKRGSKNAPAGKPAADKQPDTAPVPGAADTGGTAGVDDVAVDAAAAGQAGAAAIAGGTAAQGMDAGADAANKDAPAPAGAAGAAEAEKEGLTEGAAEVDAAFEKQPDSRAEAIAWAAFGAASLAYGASGEGKLYGMRLEDGWIGSSDIGSAKDRVNCAVEFVRANPDAPFEAAPIHLGLQRFKDVPAIGHRERAAWSVFRATLMALDAAAQAQAADDEAAKAKPAQSGGWPGDRALQPSKPGLSPSGYSPR